VKARPRAKASALAAIREMGIIPVIRAERPDAALAVVSVLADAGLTIAEVTMTVPDAIAVIARVSRDFGDRVLVGAGTVTHAETARRAVDAGAQFIVTPCLVPEVIEEARLADVAVLPGAMTPTEVFRAYDLGGDMVKVFPANSLGGAAYVRALRGPFPSIPLVPTGGVTLQTIPEIFEAGAAAVGIGSELISRDALARRDYAAIGSLAAGFLDCVRAARSADRANRVT
jgi:2-dehydro-3-deoxyphosphogluconate aldolase / (4S)-4-hydroxy-2-oxoglutarate aldolase